MLDQKGFDLWADGYDKSTGLSDEQDVYPVAGYRALLGEIYNRILSGPGRRVPDIGFGTGVLTCKLYEQGCRIWGQDFSKRMLELAQGKMPQAYLYQGDFTQGLTQELQKQTYDAIVATYSLHHLTDKQKVTWIRSLLPLLADGGCIYIGDVAFETRAELEQCRAASGSAWDEEEIYFVAQELREAFPQLEFQKVSSCAGLLSIQK